MQTTILFTLPIIREPRAVVLSEFKSLLTQSDQERPFTTRLIFTPNPEQIVLAKRNPRFLEVLKQADYLLPDGIGLVWASRILAYLHPRTTQLPIRERITGVDVVTNLLQFAKKQQQKVLIIGGRDYKGAFEGETYEDESSLKQLASNLYWTEGYQDKQEVVPIEEAALVAIIKRLQPSIVFVALGAPDQEEWLVTHRDLLTEQDVRLGMAVGGSFDFIFQKVSRAPQLWQRLGLEWLWRLMQQPWRKRRQLRLLTFIGLVLRELILPQRH